MATITTRPVTTTNGLPSPPATRLRVPQLALGLFLTAGTALVFLVWHGLSIERTPVLALATDVARGETLALEDLRVVHVGTDDALVLTPADASATVIGRTAMVDLPAGTLVTDSQLTSGPALIAGEGVVGLALQAGEYPTPDLTVGDLVTVLDVSDPDRGPVVLADAAVVASVELLGTQGQRFISVQTDDPAAQAIAGAAADGRVRLVLVPPAGEVTP